MVICGPPLLPIVTGRATRARVINVRMVLKTVLEHGPVPRVILWVPVTREDVTTLRVPKTPVNDLAERTCDPNVSREFTVHPLFVMTPLRLIGVVPMSLIPPLLNGPLSLEMNAEWNLLMVPLRVVLALVANLLAL